MKKFIITLLIVTLTALSAFAAPKWEKTDFNVYIKENPKTYVMKKAFGRWQSITNGLVRFKYVSGENDADITVEFVENLPGMAVGLCTNTYSDGTIKKSKLKLARQNKFKALLTDDEYYRIMLHEIGHAFGLGHSTKLNSIMRTNTMEITNISLDDRKDLEELYK